MLQASGLRRTFGEKVAVNDVSFDVPKGHMVGFVGGNGAGKTTTMRMLMGVLEPDRGEVLYNGVPVTRAQRARIGYMPEERGLYPKLSLITQLAYFGELKGMSRRAARASAEEHLERFGLGDRKNDPLESLSLGNEQRVQIIAAVIADPIALILDEPFSGLDPEAVDEMATILRDFTSSEVPILFSSHQLDLVERFCDDIIVLAQGEVVVQGNADELRESGPERFRVGLTDAGEWCDEVFGNRIIDRTGNEVLIELRDQDDSSELLAAAAQRGRVREFSRVRASLSEIYKEVTV